MFSVRIKGITTLHLIFQFVGIVSILWLVFAAVNGIRFGWSLDPEDYVQTTFVLLIAFILEFLTRSKETQSISGLSKLQLTAVSNRQIHFAIVSIFGTMVMFKDDSLSRAVLTTFFIVSFGWIHMSNRFGFRYLNRMLYRNESKGLLRTLVIGPVPAVTKYWESSNQPKPPGTRFHGYIPLGETNAPALPAQVPLAGAFSDLRSICEADKIKALILLGLNDRSDLIPSVVKLSSDLGLRTTWIDDVEEKFGRDSVPSVESSYSVVTVTEPLEDPVNRALKRMFDLCLSFFGIIFFLPASMILVWIVHWRYSRGPLFYRQERSGRNGETFRIFKFRSMVIGGEDKFRQATSNDDRIIPGGKFIRKYSIDELPQLLNVFLGHMSMVGPRPHPLPLDMRLAPNTEAYSLRTMAKPGITGLAQARGWRGETRTAQQIRNRLRLDLFYIKHWSLSLDIRILAETVSQLILPPKSAQ